MPVNPGSGSEPSAAIQSPSAAANASSAPGDGFGNYRTSDDPNYTPEKAGEVGSWTQMTQAP
jgi:hypothetical protein